MKNYSEKRIEYYSWLAVASIWVLASFIIGLDIDSEMSGFIAACITSIPGVIILVVMILKIKKSYRYEKLAKESRRIEEINREKAIQKAIILRKENATIAFFDEFRKKYGISFDEFRIKFIFGIDNSVTLHKVGSSSKETFLLYKANLNNCDYFILINSENDNTMAQIIRSSPLDEKDYAYLKNASIEDFDNLLHQYDELEYIQYVSDEINTTFKKQNSALGLAIHEEIFGTASAVNKAINNTVSTSLDISYLLFVFSHESKIEKMKYLLIGNEKIAESYYTGILKELWNDKNLEVLKNRKAIKNDFVEKEDYYKKLVEIKKLFDDGIISEEEYNETKKKILDKLV